MEKVAGGGGGREEEAPEAEFRVGAVAAVFDRDWMRYEMKREEEERSTFALRQLLYRATNCSLPRHNALAEAVYSNGQRPVAAMPP